MIKYIKASPDASGFYTDEELDAFVKEQREKRETYYKEKAEADAKERARIDELQRKAEDLYTRTLNAIKSVGEPTIEALSEILVPSSGKCDTLAGEIIRAAQRIQYRDWNDGDRFFSSYGLETCGSSAEFLMDYTTEEIKNHLIDIAQDDLDGDEYSEAIAQLIDYFIIPFVFTHKELFAIVPKDSRNYKVSKVLNLQPLYDFDFTIMEPEIIEAYNRGLITDDDIFSFFDEMFYGGEYSSGEVYFLNGVDNIEIINLNEDDYNAFKEHYRGALESWASELLEEYPELDDDYEED